MTTAARQSSPSHWLKLSAATIAGVLVYQLFVVVPNGYLAAIAVPKSYFMWFGKPRQELALAVVQFATAIPVFLLVTGSVLSTCRVFRARSLAFLVAILVGMLLCFLFSAITFVLRLPANIPPDVILYPASVRLQQVFASFITPWWSLPTTYAPWLGFGFATWLLRRRSEA